MKTSSPVPPPSRIEVVDDQLAEVLRDKTPAERIAMIADAYDTACLLAAAGIRYQHPTWSQSDVEVELSRRMIGATD